MAKKMSRKKDMYYQATKTGKICPVRWFEKTGKKTIKGNEACFQCRFYIPLKWFLGGMKPSPESDPRPAGCRRKISEVVPIH